MNFKEAEQLQRALNLPRPPERVETFDISNIMAGRLPAGGNQAAGSMVSFFNGKPDKSNYRRFRIREVEGIDDFQMLAEIIRRRYRRLKREGRIFPDLIIVDGGKGQLSAAVATLASLEAQIPVVAIAKREEEVFVPGRADPVTFPQDSPAKFLLMRLRDEAHRSANRHREARGKKTSKVSLLDAVPGLGEEGKKKLLRKFGSLSGIREASDRELLEVLSALQVGELRRHFS